MYADNKCPFRHIHAQGLSMGFMAILLLVAMSVTLSCDSFRRRGEGQKHTEAIARLQTIELGLLNLAGVNSTMPEGFREQNGFVKMDAVNHILVCNSVQQAFYHREAVRNGYIDLRFPRALLIRLQDGKCWSPLAFGHVRELGFAPDLTKYIEIGLVPGDVSTTSPEK